MKKKRITKGNRGYIQYEKKKRLLTTLGLFAVPLFIYISAAIYHGTNKNLLTVVALVGCLPACRAAVGLIMMMMQKPMDKEKYELAEKAKGDLIGGYELVITAYEHTSPVNAVVVCGNQLVCYTPDAKTDPAYLEKHIRQVMSANNVHNLQIRVNKDFKQYLQRVETLRKKPEQYREGITWTPDERYPDLTREEFIYYTLLAISL